MEPDVETTIKIDGIPCSVRVSARIFELPPERVLSIITAEIASILDQLGHKVSIS